MPGRTGQIRHHLNGFPPNLTNSTTQFDQASSQWISTQFDQYLMPGRIGHHLMDLHPIRLIQPGIISMDFHPI